MVTQELLWIQKQNQTTMFDYSLEQFAEKHWYTVDRNINTRNQLVKRTIFIQMSNPKNFAVWLIINDIFEENWNINDVLVNKKTNDK